MLSLTHDDVEGPTPLRPLILPLVINSVESPCRVPTSSASGYAKYGLLFSRTVARLDNGDQQEGGGASRSTELFCEVGLCSDMATNYDRQRVRRKVVIYCRWVTSSIIPSRLVLTGSEQKHYRLTSMKGGYSIASAEKEVLVVPQMSALAVVV